jgi:opacity protein-like surface antigen
MKRLQVISILVFFCICAPGLVSAANPAGYAALKLGYFTPNNDSDGLDGFDSVGTFGLAFGAKFTPNIAIEVGTEYYSTDDTESGYIDDVYVVADGTVTTWSIPITCKLIAPVSNELEAFLGLGVGLYSSKFEIEYRSEDVIVELSDTASDFGFHAEVGADYKINPNLSLGMELKWFKAELDFDDLFDEEMNVGGTSFNVVAKHMF